MNDENQRLFDELCLALDKIEGRSDPKPLLTLGDGEMPRLQVVGTEDENDQTGDVSGQIADLNDHFRQNQSADDGEIKGEWIVGDDINALDATTKAAIKQSIIDYRSFDKCPLHDRGAFEQAATGGTIRVVWMIKVYEDASLQAEASSPENPKSSYRTLLAALSD